MSIREYIVEHESDFDAAILASINAAAVVREDSTLKTNKTVILSLGMDDARLALGGLRQAATLDPLLDSVYVSLCSTGLDFANPVTQGMIDQLVTAGVFSAELGDKLKALGVITTSLAKQDLGRDATIDDVTSARVEIRKSRLRRALIVRLDAANEAIDNGMATTEAEAVAIFAQ